MDRRKIQIWMTIYSQKHFSEAVVISRIKRENTFVILNVAKNWEKWILVRQWSSSKRVNRNKNARPWCTEADPRWMEDLIFLRKYRKWPELLQQLLGCLEEICQNFTTFYRHFRSTKNKKDVFSLYSCVSFFCFGVVNTAPGKRFRP